jgi:hypothetical protein
LLKKNNLIQTRGISVKIFNKKFGLFFVFLFGGNFREEKDGTHGKGVEGQAEKGGAEGDGEEN